jgi:hypothetical protein
MASCWVPAKLPCQNKIRIPNNTQKEEEYEKQRKQAVEKMRSFCLAKVHKYYMHTRKKVLKKRRFGT